MSHVKAECSVRLTTSTHALSSSVSKGETAREKGLMFKLLGNGLPKINLKVNSITLDQSERYSRMPRLYTRDSAYQFNILTIGPISSIFGT